MEERASYGSERWCAEEYSRVPVDPWGLSWRTSQLLRYRKTLALAPAAFTHRSPLRILDVGCATGDFTSLLASVYPNAEVTGTDFVPTAIERASERFPQKGFPNLTFAPVSILDLGKSFPGRFNFATCLEILYYLKGDERISAIVSLKEALVPDAFVIFSSYISRSPHFSTADFLNLIRNQFQIIDHQVLNLKLVSVIEKLAVKAQVSVMRPRGDSPDSTAVMRLPVSLVHGVERLSATVKPLLASHTLVLAKI